MSWFHTLAIALATITLAYFAALNVVYLAFTAIAWRDLNRHLRARGHAPDDEIFSSPVTPPVSVLVPAFDEELTIVESVRSLLALRYPLHEVIVVNDGSSDATLERLQRDFDLVAQWIDAFHAEIGAAQVRTGRDIAERRLPTGNIFLWEQVDAAVAMAGFVGPTPHGVRANLVYTPPPSRGRGYASNLVAALSQHLLDSGKQFCFLYTDLANPTSNKIYRAIGYEPLGQNVHIMFDGAAGSH